MATSNRPDRVKRGNVAIDALLQAAAVLTVLFSVLTAIDTRHHCIELFSHFRLQYLVVSLLLLIVFAARRRAIYSLLLAATLAINAGYVLPWYDLPWNDDSAAATGDTQLKLLYANVLSTNRDHGRLLELIGNERPDVIALQEISSHWLEALQQLDPEYPFHYSAAREDNFGIAIWSRLPLTAATHVDSPPLGYPTLIATTRIGGTDLTLISTHPMIPLGRDNFEARNRQLRSIENIVTAASDPLILIGDINASLWDRYYRKLEDATGLRNARRGSGILPTWPTFMPLAMIPIDHVLVSSHIGIANIRTGPRIGSDHLPLIVTVIL